MDSKGLEAIGIRALEERVYTHLLAHASARSNQIARALGVPGRNIQAALDSLEQKGLVTQSLPPKRGYVASAPEAAIEALVLEYLGEIERARAHSRYLSDEFRKTQGNEENPIVELVSGSAVAVRIKKLQRSLEVEHLGLDKPPYVVDDPTQPSEAAVGALARGVSTRIIYNLAGLEETPGYIQSVQILIEAGEHARVLPDLPLKLWIMDRSTAIVPVSLDDPTAVLIVHRSGLLDALVALFENLWSRAIPIGSWLLGESRGEVTEDELRALSLLALGYKESSAARELDIAVRTLQRRLAELMDRVGAHTRLQLMVHAAKNGWV